MKCDVRLNSITAMQDKGALSGSMEIINMSLFKKLNNNYSNFARSKYGVTNEGELFETQLKSIRRPGPTPYYREDNITIVKAVLNNEMFTELQKKHDEYHSENPRTQGVMKQKPGTVGTAASPKVISLVKEFLKNIGVDIKTVKQIITADGRYLDDNGIAELTQKLVQVIEGKEDVALTEEAMHFAVEILEQTNPKLFNKLLNEIGNYNIYNETLAEYSLDEDYQTSDGKPDIRKIKKEAIGKLLSEMVIEKGEALIDDEGKLNKAMGFWQSIVEWLKSLFVKSGFDQVTKDILSGKSIGTADDIRAEQGAIMKQKSAQDTLYDSIKAKAASISKIDESYYIGDKQIPMRVTQLVDKWYERRFRSKELIKSDYQKAVDEQRQEKGTAGHKDLEYAFSRFVDDDGYLRTTYLNDDDYESKLNKYERGMYEILRDNLRARLESFPKGTRFLKETTIYNGKSLAGTIDFMAITPEAKINILDWKFIDISSEDSKKDVPWYKIAAWNLQMENYKNILKVGYGVKEEQFGQTRMIPIRAEYIPGSAKQNRMPILVDVQIGDVNVKNIQETYLIPVGLENEKTGIRQVDELLQKLNAIYKKMSEQKALPSQKREKADQLNSLFQAIRQLQMRQDVIPLLNQAQVLNKQLQNVINTYTTKFEGQDSSSFTEEEISSFAADLLNANDAISVYSNLSGYLRFLFQTGQELTEEQKKLKDLVNDVASEAKDIEMTLAEKTEDFVDKIIAGSEGVKGILSPEKIIKGITKLFSSTSTIQLKSMEVLYKKANKAFTYAAMDTLDETKKLQKLKEAYDNWARSKGLSLKSYFDIIKKKDDNELIDEFNSGFYSELRKNIQDKNTEWLKNNIDVAAFKTEMADKLKEEFDRIENKLRIGTPEEIERDVKKEKADAIKLYDVSTDTSVGWFQYDILKKFPDRGTWESKEWKELTAKGNEAAKDFYDYIVKRNKYYNDIGYINAKQTRVFLPYVRKGLIEKLIFGGNVSIGEQFMRNISIDEGDVGYGKTDPITGKPIDTVPIYFTKEIEGELSTDLFRTMALYNEMAIKYKYVSDIEDQMRAIVRVEKNKQAIKTSYFGKTQYKDDGQVDTNPDNSENAKLVEDMVKAIIYGQKYIQSDSFDLVLGKLGNFGEKLNKKLGVKILPENLSDRQLSINKVVTQLNNTFQLTTLGFNVLSATSNLFGGTAQSIINAGKYFTKTDYTSTEAWLIMNKMGGQDAKKAIAALEYFLPLTENYNKEIAKTLSLSKFSAENVQEFLMILMRKTDLHVQTVSFFSYLKNSIVENGEIVNARDLLRKDPKYSDKYAGTVEQRKALDEEFEEDVRKLVEEKGVMKLGSIVDGEFVIPGIDRKSKSVIKLRRTIQSLSKDALGNLSDDDLRKINMTVYGKSFMIFKNWIPRLVDVRFGNIKYNSASDAYEWGRMRTVYRVLSEDLVKSLGNLRNSLLGNEKGVEFLRQLYEKKKEEYKKDTNKDLEMTETEFMDLVRSNVRNQMYDTIFLLTLLSILTALKAYEPDEEEDPAVRNQYKYLLKMADKMKDELMYFYDPTSITKLVSQGVFPSVSLIDNFMKVIKNFMVENYAIAIGDEKLQKETYVLKYVMKSFPMASQALGWLPMFYPDMAKDLGIKVQSQSGFIR